VLEVAGADHELIEAAAEKAGNRPPQDRNSSDGEKRFRRIV
jgi:hypothetical protein